MLVRDMHSRLPELESALAEAPVAIHGQNRQRRRAVGVEPEANVQYSLPYRTGAVVRYRYVYWPGQCQCTGNSSNRRQYHYYCHTVELLQ